MDRIQTSILNYKKAGIEIEILENDSQPWKVKIKQVSLLNGFILNQKELIARAKEVFADINTNVVPVTYSLQLKMITPAWIQAQMAEHNVKIRDFEKQLALNPVTAKGILSGNAEIDRNIKVALFYYFLNHKVNRELRDHQVATEATI